MNRRSAAAMPIDPRRDVARLRFRACFAAPLEVSKALRVVIRANQERARESGSRKQQRRPGGDALCESYVAGTVPTATETVTVTVAVHVAREVEHATCQRFGLVGPRSWRATLSSAGSTSLGVGS